jgi:hypothetical protein
MYTPGAEHHNHALLCGRPELTYYEEQLATLGQQREQMLTVIAKWWTPIEEKH